MENDPTPKPKLPTVGAQDGECVLVDGCVYEFNAEKNEWISKGVIPDPGVVSFKEDGLVSPDIFRKLSLIQELIEKGFDFSNFKLDSGDFNPYFYYFHSTDDLIKFIPEKVVEPKEVRGAGRVIGFNPGRPTDGPTIVVTTDTATFVANSFIGLELESKFGHFEIVGNTISQVIVKGDANQTSLRIGDSVKIVKPERINHQLRVEIDKGRLYQKLVRNCCVGPKGSQGEKGDRGTDGTPAALEEFQLPSSVEDNIFSWNTIVNTPIDTPISLRIFRQDDIIVEVVFPLDGTSPMILINDENIEIEVSSADVDFSPTSNRFSGSLTVIAGGDDIDSWRFKARQKGPKGAAGSSGKAFLEVIEQILDDPSIRSTEAIISMRKASNGDIIFLTNTLFDEIPVSNLSAIDGDSILDILTDKFTSVQATIREAKSIGFFQFAPAEFVPPILDIPLWTPTADCVQARRWSQYRFDWYDRSDPTYLFSITPTPKPPEKCCQEDFFFCPNVGDNPCEIQGTPEPPTPFPVPCSCECENPIGGQFSGGGFVLDPIDLTNSDAAVNGPSGGVGVIGDSSTLGGVSPEEAQEELELNGSSSSDVKATQTRGVESVINGTEQHFIQDIALCGNGEIEVSIEFDSGVCGGAVAEREQCAFVNSGAVHVSYGLVDRNNVSSPGNNFIETGSIPARISFPVSTSETILPDVPPEDVPPGMVAHPAEEGCVPEVIEDPQFCTAEFATANFQLSIVVNGQKQDFCRGYRLVITARSDRFECKKERTFIIEDPSDPIIPPKDTPPPPPPFIPPPPPPPIIDIPPPPPFLPPPEEPPPITELPTPIEAFAITNIAWSTSTDHYVVGLPPPPPPPP